MKRLLITSILLFTYTLLPFSKQQMLAKLLDSTRGRPVTYIMSQLRSGNTWFRYLTEWFTQRPTLEYADLGNNANWPLGFITGHAINTDKSPLWKVHRIRALDFAGIRHDTQRDILIVLVRNPKEVIVRNVGSVHAMRFNSWDYVAYFDVLKVYDCWNPRKRLLIYYEDMMSSPRESIIRILDFLGETTQDVDDFMTNYDYHKNKALMLYDHLGGSQTKGEALIKHSLKLTAEERNEIDAFMAKKYEPLWNTYLKERYAEKSVD